MQHDGQTMMRVGRQGWAILNSTMRFDYVFSSTECIIELGKHQVQ